jgi:hypothetical protein
MHCRPPILFIVILAIGAAFGTALVETVGNRASQPSPPSNQVSPTNAAPFVPEIDKGEATGQKLDSTTVSPDNNGFLLDMNGDGVDDLIILNGHRVLFKDRNAGPLVCILVIQANIVAYSIGSDAIYYWDEKHDGYKQRKLGVNGGIPYFGNVEGQ